MGIERMGEWLSKSPDMIDQGMARLEAGMLAVVGRVATWVSPLPSAVLVGRAMESVFELGGAWPWIMAGVVEFVGLTTTAWWTTARDWNATRTRKGDPRANERLAVGLMAGYFGTTVALLLAVEVPMVLETGNVARLTALLFPGLSLVSLIALSERVAHYRRVESVKEDTTGRTVRRPAGRTAGQLVGDGLHSRNAQSGSEQSANGGQQMASVGAQYAEMSGLEAANRTREARRDAQRRALLELYQGNPALGATEAARVLKVHRNTIGEYRRALVNEGLVRLVRVNGGNRVERVEVL